MEVYKGLVSNGNIAVAGQGVRRAFSLLAFAEVSSLEIRSLVGNVFGRSFVSRRNDLFFDQCKKAAACRGTGVTGIVGIVETLSKQLFVQLSDSRHLQTTADTPG